MPVCWLRRTRYSARCRSRGTPSDVFVTKLHGVLRGTVWSRQRMYCECVALAVPADAIQSNPPSNRGRRTSFAASFLACWCLHRAVSAVPVDCTFTFAALTHLRARAGPRTRSKHRPVCAERPSCGEMRNLFLEHPHDSIASLDEDRKARMQDHIRRIHAGLDAKRKRGGHEARPQSNHGGVISSRSNYGHNEEGV